MTIADASVKFFHSAMSGAPVLSGQAGALIAILDACLVNGWGLVTLDSLVVSGNVATATRASGVTPIEVDTVVSIAGVTGALSALNGDWKIATVDATHFTFATSGIADGTAAGTITMKLAPAGWAKTYAGTNLAAYKSADVAALAMLLHVDDTGTTNARLRGYETMSDVNTGTGPFPTTAQSAGGGYWPKSSTANATARDWILFADSRAFYFCRAYSAGSTTDFDGGAFGDIIPTKSGDAYACFLQSRTTDDTGFSPIASPNPMIQFFSSSSNGCYVARSYTALGAATTLARSISTLRQGINSVLSGASTFSTPFPNTGDGGLYVSPVMLSEDANSYEFRGLVPGIYGCPQNLTSSPFATRDKVTGVTGLPGKILMAVQNSSSGAFFVDITGPWR